MPAFRLVHTLTGRGQELNEFVASLIQLAVPYQDDHVAIGNGGNHQDTGKDEPEAGQHAMFDRSVLKGVDQPGKKRILLQDTLGPRGAGSVWFVVEVDGLLAWLIRPYP